MLKISAKIKEDSSLYKEGKFIDSVSTDGGVIQKPKTPATVSAEDETDENGETKSSKKSTKETIGIDADGNYVYPTDDDGNLIIPTDANGDFVYPTDEDGNVKRNPEVSVLQTPSKSIHQSLIQMTDL